jgi:magnesium chelatase family protein
LLGISRRIQFSELVRYSGPLLDRIDIHIEVPAVPYKELSSATCGSASAQMREQVTRAREAQRHRFNGSPIRQNAHMSHRQIREHCRLDDAGMNLLRATVTELGLSARAHDKILRVARTIADLDGSNSITTAHLNEAVNYRMLDRQLWT